MELELQVKTLYPLLRNQIQLELLPSILANQFYMTFVNEMNSTSSLIRILISTAMCKCKCIIDDNLIMVPNHIQANIVDEISQFLGEDCFSSKTLPYSRIISCDGSKTMIGSKLVWLVCAICFLFWGYNPSNQWVSHASRWGMWMANHRCTYCPTWPSMWLANCPCIWLPNGSPTLPF